MLASDVIKKIEFADPVTHELVCKTMERAYSPEDFDDEGHRIGGRMFAREFAEVLHTNLSWAEISKHMAHHEETHKYAKIRRYPVHLLMVLYDEGLYNHHDKGALEVLMPNLKTFEGGHKIYTDLFNPIYRDLYGICFSYFVGIRYSYPILVGDPELRKLLFKFGNSAPIGIFNYDVVVTFFSNFEQSLPCKFSGYKCLSTDVIESQARYYMDLNLFWGHYLKRPKSMPSLFALFYRWLYETFPDNNILSDRERLDERVLYYDRFTEMIIGGSFDYAIWNNKRRVHGMGTSQYNPDKVARLPLNDILRAYEETLPTRMQKERFALVKPLFGKSLGADVYRIRSHKDLNESTFFRQLEYFRSKFGHEPLVFKEVTEAIRRFYSYFIDQDPKWQIFQNSRRISKATIKSRCFSRLYTEGYEFVTRSHINYDRDITKLVVSYLPTDVRHASMPPSISFYKINCTPIPSRSYRNMFTRFLFSNQAVEGKYLEGNNIMEMLRFLFTIKTIPGSPSPDIHHLSPFEAEQIRTTVMNKNIKDKGKGRMLNAFKQFFIWAEDSNYMTIAPMAMVHFRSIPSSRSLPKIESVPQEHIELIARFFLDMKAKSFRYELSFVILNLVLQTPFRLMDICRLERDCLIETGKKDVYIIRLKSKTSENEYEDRTIPIATYRLVKQAIKRTEEYIRICSIEEYKNLAFVLPSPTLGGVIPFSPQNFADAVKRACIAHSLPVYKPSNLRKTYMTFTYIESSKRPKEDGEYFLRANSYHKNKRTTLAHYVDRSKVLMNSSFGYSLGSEDELKAVEASFVQNPSKETKSPERVTPDGIGFCNSKDCIGMVTCLGCKHLILTEESLPALRHILSNLDNQIVNCEIDHERDGLIDIRAAYSRCLDLINQHIQKNNESGSN